MSWIGWCIILAAIYAGYILLRSLVDLVNWLVDVFLREPRERENLRKLARQHRKHATAGSAHRAPADVASPAHRPPAVNGKN